MFQCTRLLCLCGVPFLLAASSPLNDGYGNPYSANDVFSKIARHEPPYKRSLVAYEDKNVMVFADIAPWATGHMLVIARNSPARSLIDMPAGTLAKMMAVVRRVMIAQRDALGATGAEIFISNGSLQSVPHLHIHVVPHYKGQPIPLPPAVEKRVPDSELVGPTAKIARAMASQ